MSPGQSVVLIVSRNVTETLAAHSWLAFEAAQRRILDGNMELFIRENGTKMNRNFIQTIFL